MRKTKNETEEYLRDFTLREDALIARAKAANLTLPERLVEWRQWIGDSQIYLCELHIFIERNKA